MILEVDEYTNLDTLAADISHVANDQDFGVINQIRPLKIEMNQDNFNKVMKDLKSYASYEGIRNENELEGAKWNVAGTYVTFIVREDGTI